MTTAAAICWRLASSMSLALPVRWRETVKTKASAKGVWPARRAVSGFANQIGFEHLDDVGVRDIADRSGSDLGQDVGVHRVRPLLQMPAALKLFRLVLEEGLVCLAEGGGARRSLALLLRQVPAVARSPPVLDRLLPGHVEADERIGTKSPGAGPTVDG
jgi:hypothetical protein